MLDDGGNSRHNMAGKFTIVHNGKSTKTRTTGNTGTKGMFTTAMAATKLSRDDTPCGFVGFPGDGWWYTPKFGVCDDQLPFLVWAWLGAGKFSQLLNLSGGRTWNWMTPPAELRWVHNGRTPAVSRSFIKNGRSKPSCPSSKWVSSAREQTMPLELENLKHSRTVVSGSEQSLMSELCFYS